MRKEKMDANFITASNSLCYGNSEFETPSPPTPRTYDRYQRFLTFNAISFKDIPRERGVVHTTPHSEGIRIKSFFAFPTKIRRLTSWGGGEYECLFSWKQSSALSWKIEKKIADRKNSYIKINISYNTYRNQEGVIFLQFS